MLQQHSQAAHAQRFSKKVDQNFCADFSGGGFQPPKPPLATGLAWVVTIVPVKLRGCRRRRIRVRRRNGERPDGGAQTAAPKCPAPYTIGESNDSLLFQSLYIDPSVEKV